MNQRGVIYIRVSTEDQRNFSPEAQRADCEAYASRPEVNLKIVRTFEEARSGWKANARVEFYKMLEFIEQEKISNLIYAYGDRLSRNTEDYVMLKATGVTLHNAISGISFSPSDPDHYDQTAAFEHDQVEAKRFSAKNSKKVRDSYATIVAMGFWPHSLPIGLKHGPDIERSAKLRGERRTIEFENEHDRADLVRQMFRLWITGEYTGETITTKMKELGLRSRKGRVISRTQIESYLKDSKYAGRYFEWQGVRHEWKENAPALIPLDIWEEAREIFNRKKKRGSKQSARDYRYKDLIKCDFCGRDIICDPQERVKKNGEKVMYLYYRCTGGKGSAWYQEHLGRPKCPMTLGPYYVEADLDQFFQEAFENLYVDPGVYEWLRGQIEEDYKNLKDLRAEETTRLKSQLTTSEATISAMAQKVALSKPPLTAIFERELEKLERDRLQAEARLRDIESGREAESLKEVEETFELAKSLKEQYLAASPEKRRRFNKLLFRTVRLTKPNMVAESDEGDPAPTMAPYYFVWNEPFRTLWEIGFIQGLSEATAEDLEAERVRKLAEKKVERA